MSVDTWPHWHEQPPRGGYVGVRKPHISFARFRDGSLMVEVRSWPDWPHSTEGLSVAAGYDLSDAWDSHMLQFEDEENEEAIAA